MKCPKAHCAALLIKLRYNALRHMDRILLHHVSETTSIGLSETYQLNEVPKCPCHGAAEPKA